jgi:hypothetical protein
MKEQVINNVFNQVWRERARQTKLWGAQRLPDGTGEYWDFQNSLAKKVACNAAHVNGTLTWRDILDEEVWEAFAETDPHKIEEELVQVIAVAVAWIEDMRSRHGEATETAHTD